MPEPHQLPAFDGLDDAMIRAAAYTLQEHPELPLVVLTWSGQAAFRASKIRPRGPIYGLTPDARVVDRLKLAWGITPLLVPPVRSTTKNPTTNGTPRNICYSPSASRKSIVSIGLVRVKTCFPIVVPCVYC